MDFYFFFELFEFVFNWKLENNVQVTFVLGGGGSKGDIDIFVFLFFFFLMLESMNGVATGLLS